jgi:hypothetical protein
MKIRQVLLGGALAVSGITATLAVPAATLAACDDGHWPASVQGRPTTFHAGGAAGDYIWHDGGGWHVRVTHANARELVFTGTIVSDKPLDADPVKLEGRDTVGVSADRKTITFRLDNYGGIDGFDFTTACSHRLTFRLSIGGADTPIGRIRIGSDNRHPLENPFSVTRVD